MIKVLLVDDQALIRQAFAALLALESDLVVVGQAADAASAVELVVATRPDVVLMDVQLSPRSTSEPSSEATRESARESARELTRESGAGEDGITATAQITTRSPRTRVIVLTTFGRPGYLRRAMEAGAVGFLVKDAPADRLVDGIRRVHQGLRVVDPTLAATSLAIGGSPLTERETEVLTAATGGRSSQAIAAGLHLSEGTVRNHLSAAMGKIGASTRAEAVRIATDNGWLD